MLENNIFELKNHDFRSNSKWGHFVLVQAYWPLCPDPSSVGVVMSHLFFIWGVRSLDV